MWVIQLEETFLAGTTAIEAQKKMRELPDYLGGRVLNPNPYGPWTVQAFFKDTIEHSTVMPDSLSLVYIPECLEEYFGIKK